ncbi:MmgE/PrpD family protein [Pseudomonas sp. NPDC007930]|uniref:MmgE/PrpD family protein n=1 Tax=Pseudomonas sp. NPDC007930 TaxID=3364417 RepID=UPI0036E4A47D
MISLSQQLAIHLHATPWSALPSTLVEHSKTCLADTLAVAWAGLEADGVPAVRQLALAEGGAGQASLWGAAQRLPAGQAAWVNGVAAAALDFDALHVSGTVHADIVALPALLAVAQQRGASGLEFLHAYILAVDVICRLGEAVRRYDGWFNTSVCGVIGAAAGAARLLGLPAQGITHAMGFALAQAAGTQQPMVEQSQAKRLQSAFAARAAVHSAQLAAAGLNAPAQALEGRFGLFSLYTGGDAETVLEGLGLRWPGLQIAIKRYPNCGCAHAALDLTLGLATAHDVSADAVLRVDVALPEFSTRLVGAAYSPATNPQVAAQFSVQYAVAVALLHRRFELEHIEPASALDPQALALAKRIHVRTTAGPGRMYPAEVVVQTASESLVARANAAPPALAGGAALAKARACFAYADAQREGERLLARIDVLEQLPSIEALLQ